MTVAAHEERVTDRVELVSLDLIDPAPDNPRRQIGDVTELAQSIQALGLLEPLVITPRGDRYLLVCGARRHAACIVAGLDATTCVIREFSETERQEAMLIENLQREDLSVLEEATAYSRLVELGQTQRQLAERVGRSQAHISKRLAILDLPEAVQAKVDSGGITLEDAQQLGKLGDHPKRLESLIKRYANHDTIPGWAIDEELRSIARAKKVEQTIAKLKKTDETVVKMNGYQPPKGYARVAPGYWNTVDMDPAKHAKLACHAVGVTGNADVIELCNDAAKHPKKKEPAATGASKAQRETEKRRKDLLEAAASRREFAYGLVRGKVAKDDVLEAALPAMLVVDIQEGLELACRALQVEDELKALLARDAESAEAVEEFDVYAEFDCEAFEATLNERAAKSATERIRVTFAVAVGAIEELLTPQWGEPRWDLSAPYYALLKRHGYKPSKVEQAAIDAAAKAGR